MVSLTLEALAMLCHPDVCLNPATPRALRQVEEGPNVSEAADMVAALLASWQHLSGAQAAGR